MSASANLHRTAVGIGQVPRRSMIPAVKAVKAEANRHALAATGDGRMSNAGRSKLRTRDSIRGGGSAVSATIWGLPTGMWVWITDGTDPHAIAPRRRRRRGRSRRGGAGTLAGKSFGPVRGAVRHPGTQGQDAWRKVGKAAERIVPETFVRDVRRVIGA